jgi:putative hydrolase of the HAD superfamily
MAAVKAVLLDALGTLVRLEPPVPRLRERLSRLGGVEIDEETAARGFAAEITYYLANHLEGGDPTGLERLRSRCAREMARAMDLEERLEPDLARRVMLESLEFSPYPDVLPALSELRGRGLRLVAVSNWDCSLPWWLERAGLGELLDGAVSSAVIGVAKPAEVVFSEGLRVAGVPPEQALHVGDSIEADVKGAQAAGIPALLLVREGEPPAGVHAIRSLAELLPSLT